MKKISLLFFTLLLSNFLFSQSTFQREYGSGSWDHGYSVKQTVDHNYIVAGEAGGSAFVMKVNEYGDTLWNKNYEPHALFACIQLTTDGGYVMCGSKEKLGVGTDAYLVKINSNGDTLWAKSIGRGGYDAANSLQQTTDEGYIITGCTFDSTDASVYVVKCNANGDTTWTRKFGEVGNDQGTCVQQTTDGGYIICGIGATEGLDACLIKIDDNGNLVWWHTYGGSNMDYASSVLQTPDGGYLLVGETWSFGAGYSDAYWVRTDANGNILWTRTFGGSSFDNTSEVQQTEDGGYIAVGQTASFGVSPGNYYNVYLVKTNAVGDLQWQRTFGALGKDIQGRSVQQTLDGGYILAGYTLIYSPARVKVELIKTSDQGNVCTPVSMPHRARICSGDSLVIGKHVYHNSGVYSDTLGHGMGCDTIIITHLSVEPLPVITAFSTAAHVCQGGTVALNASGATTYTWSNGMTNGVYFTPPVTAMYTVTGTNEYGCIGSATVKVIVDPRPDASCTFGANNIFSNQNGASYQWLNCADSSLITGADQQSYTPLLNGSYAVIVDLHGCIDTSDCVSFNGVGVADLFSSGKKLFIYPNPARGSFFVRSSDPGLYFLFNNLGEILRSFRLERREESAVVDNLAAGVYFVISADNSIRQKVVVE